MRHDEEFEEWYGAWQEKMRADERMRWLVEARNTVEKQGDLDLHSIATRMSGISQHSRSKRTRTRMQDQRSPIAANPAASLTISHLAELMVERLLPTSANIHGHRRRATTVHDSRNAEG
jgi:hypothetical protein